MQVAAPPVKPVLVYDGDCRFCCRWVARWQHATGDTIEYLPYQNAQIPLRYPEIPKEQFERAVQLIVPDGTVLSGAEAVFRSLAESGSDKWLLYFYENSPPFAFLADVLYRFVAEHRTFLSKLDRAFLPD